MPGSFLPAPTRTEKLGKESLAGFILLFPVFFLVLILGGFMARAIASAFFLGMMALIFGRFQLLAGIKLHLKRHDFRICPVCRQALVGLGDKGACPECGYAFRYETLKAIWCSEYQMLADLERHTIRLEDLLKCASCGYSIDGLPDEGKCPECGARYTAEVFHIAREMRTEGQQGVTSTHSTPYTPTPPSDASAN